MNGTDKFFYIAGWMLFAGFILLVILQGTGTLRLTDLGFPCSFRAITGYYCPGCGGTHAVCSLAAGDLIACIREHAFVFYTAAGVSLFLLWNSISLLSGKGAVKKHAPQKKIQIPVMHFHMFYLYIGIAILMLQWIIKNAFLITNVA